MSLYQYLQSALLIFITAAALSSCGYQLSQTGSNLVWDTTDEVLQVTAAKNFADYAAEIQNLLPAQLQPPGDKVWRLEITDIRHDRNVILTDQFQRDLEHQLILNLQYVIHKPDGTRSLPISLSLKRRIFQPLDSLADTRQLDSLFVRELQRQAARTMLRRVNRTRSREQTTER